MKINFLCSDGWMINHNFLWKGHNEAAQGMATVYTDAGRVCRKIGIISMKKCVTNKFL
jgi:hypothetical protein